MATVRQRAAAHAYRQRQVVDDPGLTTDIARILRMPGTFNHKYDPPKPVELSPLPLKLYDFEKDLAIVKTFAGPIVHPPGPQPAHNIFAEGVKPGTSA